MLPGMLKYEAMKQAANLRFIIEQSSVVIDDELLYVTCSFGVADSTEASDIMKVVRKADTGLYLGEREWKEYC